jgi:uncharacterized membrane protein
MEAGEMHFTWGDFVERASRDSRIVPGDVFGSGTVSGGTVGEARARGYAARYTRSCGIDRAPLLGAPGRMAERKTMGRTVGALVAVAGATAAYRVVSGKPPVPDWLAARLPHTDGSGELTVKRAVTILRARHEIYAFWRDFSQLPDFLDFLHDARIVEQRENELIRWESASGSDMQHRGEVRFQDAPTGRGTEVRLRLEYAPTAGVVGATIAQVLGRGADRKVRESLRHVKQLMEAGEIPTNDGQPMGNCVGD